MALADLPLVYYAARSSWISQASPALPDRDVEPSGSGGEWERRIVAGDLGKTIVDRLGELQPDVLVLDLIDERLRVCRIGRAWFTHSNYLERTFSGARLLAAAEEACTPIDPRRLDLFADAARRLVPRLLAALPRTQCVLHAARHATHTTDGIALAAPQVADPHALNGAQTAMVTALRSAFGARLRCITPPAEVCVADPAHRWGVATYHYTERYYQWLVDALRVSVESA